MNETPVPVPSERVMKMLARAVNHDYTKTYYGMPQPSTRPDLFNDAEVMNWVESVRKAGYI